MGFCNVKSIVCIFWGVCVKKQFGTRLHIQIGRKDLSK